ncbi:ATP-binding protein [Pseudorhodobacter sp. W20_MBD10_FR17]|uniref:ATP-binding protein n=1 Tax=Pseudorhodobacter sp. W20_MBD10_FR17 TaxID=3240266 RepID=UPI003F9730E0
MKKQAMQFTIEGSPLAVRRGLAAMLACSALRGLDVCARGTAEIVLAEVFNNIVEHAYAGQAGSISVSLCDLGMGVEVVVTDQGHAFPQEQLPQGKLPPIDASQDLPEGGFGWYLIRTLVQDLTYRRSQSTNHLSFVLPADATLARVD